MEKVSLRKFSCRAKGRWHGGTCGGWHYGYLFTAPADESQAMMISYTGDGGCEALCIDPGTICWDVLPAASAERDSSGLPVHDIYQGDYLYLPLERARKDYMEHAVCWGAGNGKQSVPEYARGTYMGHESSGERADALILHFKRGASALENRAAEYEVFGVRGGQVIAKGGQPLVLYAGKGTLEAQQMISDGARLCGNDIEDPRLAKIHGFMAGKNAAAGWT